MLSRHFFFFLCESYCQRDIFPLSLCSTWKYCSNLSFFPSFWACVIAGRTEESRLLSGRWSGALAIFHSHLDNKLMGVLLWKCHLFFNFNNNENLTKSSIWKSRKKKQNQKQKCDGFKWVKKVAELKQSQWRNKKKKKLFNLFGRGFICAMRKNRKNMNFM